MPGMLTHSRFFVVKIKYTASCGVTCRGSFLCQVVDSRQDVEFFHFFE